MSEIERLNKKVKSLENQRKYAWGKFFSMLEDNVDNVSVIVKFVENIKEIEGIPEHISKEFFEMSSKLKVEYTCPVCLDIPEKDNIQMTTCGHIYCKECLKKIKESPDPKCAICRKKIYVKDN